MNKIIPVPQFIGENNLEFTLSHTDKYVGKILYRSFGDKKKFRNNILSFLHDENLLEPSEYQKIKIIFESDFLENETFHFGCDSHTNRYKFYISLYHHSVPESLKIIGKLREILGIREKYFLEKNFISFDCLGFDISGGKISMKIYELLKVESADMSYLPEFIPQDEVKEFGVLKDMYGRKKYFFRLVGNLNLGVFKDDFTPSSYKDIKNILSDYRIRERVKYYCYEGNRREIYFV